MYEKRMEAIGNEMLVVLVSDVLALRGASLAAAETWALLCQAAQALQDLFLSNGGVVGGGSQAGPVVTPYTLELTPRGRVTLQIAPQEPARGYLPPEYRPDRLYSDTDSEKMWMYSLGRALLDTTPRVAALTGSVSVSHTSALQSVLAAMTEPDPERRASLMTLLDVISEYCRTRMLTKPFTLIVIDMYQEVVKSSQYSKKTHAACQPKRLLQICPPYYNYYNHSQYKREQQPKKNKQSMPPTTNLHYSKHESKVNYFKFQSQNSRSHPNLSSFFSAEVCINNQKKPEFQSQVDIKSNYSDHFTVSDRITHARTHSQPIYLQCGNELTKIQSNLALWNENNGIKIGDETICVDSTNDNGSSDPIYAFPVKPFLSSQDVRVNGLSIKPFQSTIKQNDFYAELSKRRMTRDDPSDARIQSNMAVTTDAIENHTVLSSSSRSDNNVIYHAIFPESTQREMNSLHKPYSHPQLPIVRTHSFVKDTDVLQAELNINRAQTNCRSSIAVDSGYKTVPLNLLKSNALHQSYNNNAMLAPPKPPRIGMRNGPRARRGKPVQRASSRLYRTIIGPVRGLNTTQCIGPEFVVRANQSSKMLKVGNIKDGENCNVGRIVVILLTGQRIDIICDSHKITAGELFQAIVHAESLNDNFTFGLAALVAGDFVMLPLETKLSKVSPPGWLTSDKCKGPLCLPTSFTLYLRQRFFLPSLRGVRSWISKHLLYLQIRRCILEQQLICTLSQLINLTGLALQAEFGNYSVNEHARGNYFLLEHYIPESLILNHNCQHSQLYNANELRGHLHQAHRNRRGLDTNTAEELFIIHAQEFEDYGLHLYIATTNTKELEKTIERLAQYRLKNFACTRGSAADLTKIANAASNTSQFNNIINSPNFIYDIIQPTASHETYCNIESKENIYAIPKIPSTIIHDKEIKHSIRCSSKSRSTKKSETNIWFGIYSLGFKLFERTGESRQVVHLIKLPWKDIRTLSYSKNSLIIYTKNNEKRTKLKLRMEYKKSYYAFKLASLHHQFFLKLRSELTSLQGLTREFGVPVNPVLDLTLTKNCQRMNKMKSSKFNEQTQVIEMYPTSLEDHQNKENENPMIVGNVTSKLCTSDDNDNESICYTPEDDALYTQVNARLEPEGASRDTEDESERILANTHDTVSPKSQFLNSHTNGNWSMHQCVDAICDPLLAYDAPKLSSNNNYNLLNENITHPEELYAAINKPTKFFNGNEIYISGHNKIWNVQYSGMPSRALIKVKTSSLPNYGAPRQSTDFRTPSLPRRLGVKMGTRAINSSSQVLKDFSLNDDIELLSLKSNTISSIQSTSAQSNESPMPEAYVLNADIGMDSETFRISNDDTMSTSLIARLEELSFAEERMLRTIKLERGHGGSIGLQVTEGNDGGVYVQAISVGGSADMTGNVTKGDKIVAINGFSLLNLRYHDALKMLQSSPCQEVELILSQTVSKQYSQSLKNQPNHVKQISNMSESSSNSCSTDWLSRKALNAVPAQNIVSSASNHCTQNVYRMNVIGSSNTLNSASLLLNIDDFDVIQTSHQVFI